MALPRRALVAAAIAGGVVVQLVRFQRSLLFDHGRLLARRPELEARAGAPSATIDRRPNITATELLEEYFLW
jgi:hypothetical protein